MPNTKQKTVKAYAILEMTEYEYDALGDILYQIGTGDMFSEYYFKNARKLQNKITLLPSKSKK